MFAYSAGLMISVFTPIRSVSPSGGDFATAPAPTLPEAPGRLSTTIACPHAACRCGARVRARMSMPVRGVKGTTMRTSLPGQADWANAWPAAPAPSTPEESTPSRARRRGSMGFKPFVSEVRE
jgi:hypothetical protein